MNAAATYRIVDEPAPGRATHLVVDPLWPLLSFMLAGTWLSWPWFVLNGHAMGSPTRWRETVLVVAGAAGTVALALLFAAALQAGWLSRGDTWWALLGVTLWKMGVSYWVFVLQSRTFDLYTYFGGRVRNGLLVVLAAFFVRGQVLALIPYGLWRLVLV